MRPMMFVLAATSVVGLTAASQADQPIPIGLANISFSYMTNNSGLRVLEGQFDYSGVIPGDATPLGGDPNVLYFNSVNAFGRRPLIPGAVGADESVLTHVFFKPPSHDTDFFDDIIPDGDVTLSVQNIQFANPVFLQTDTFMLHKLWDVDQLDLVDFENPPFIHSHAHNHDTQTDPFRNFDDFFPLVFSNFPPNYRLEQLAAAQVSGDGTDTLGFSITIPYELFRHQEEDPFNPLTIPGGLPAPFGFLEPFSFHLEMVVSEMPEPACPWDCDGGESTDGVVGITDLLALLAQWSQVGTPCDNDGGGVGLTDLMDLLAHWGPCT